MVYSSRPIFKPCNIYKKFIYVNFRSKMSKNVQKNGHICLTLSHEGNKLPMYNFLYIHRFGWWPYVFRYSKIQRKSKESGSLTFINKNAKKKVFSLFIGIYFVYQSAGKLFRIVLNRVGGCAVSKRY